MQIQVNINLGPEDSVSQLPGSASDIALTVLQGAGGDPEKDTCNVYISDQGAAGNVPTPVPPTPLPDPPKPEPPIEIEDKPEPVLPPSASLAPSEPVE